jgi:glycerol-3-phosphate dehydrogenase
MWSRDEALAAEPLLSPAGLHGAAAFTEYLTDDARLVLANIVGAHDAGALVANHAAVTALDRTRATVTDALSGETYAVRARVVVNAAGPWADEVRKQAHAEGGRRLQLTKGIHLVVPHARLPVRHSVIMTARDKRSIFVVPRDGMTYIGTTDTFYPSPTLVPEVTREDAGYLLEATNRTFRDTRLTVADLCGSWSGLRPLLAEEGKSPSEISRRDEIMVDDASGLVTIAGGKLTAYRRMAERVVDLVYTRLGRRAEPCRTEHLPLPGGETAAPALPETLTSEARGRLGRLYGASAARLLARDPLPHASPAFPGCSGPRSSTRSTRRWRSRSKTCSSGARVPSSSTPDRDWAASKRSRTSWRGASIGNATRKATEVDRYTAAWRRA